MARSTSRFELDVKDAKSGSVIGVVQIFRDNDMIVGEINMKDGGVIGEFSENDGDIRKVVRGVTVSKPRKPKTPKAPK